MDALTVVFGAIDAPLVIGIVVLIQVAKKVVKIPSKWWMLVLIMAGFAAAWLKVDVTKVGMKTLIIQGIIYSAAAELAYQGWRTITDSITVKRKLPKG